MNEMWLQTSSAGPRLRQVFPAAHFHSIEGVGQQPKAEAND